MKNAEVAERLVEIADLLDVLGERFKPEAYRRAARSIEALADDVNQVAARGQLEEIPGVGAAIDEKVTELLRTGAIAYLERLRHDVPPGLRELMRLPGLGPKTARRFWTEFGIEGPAELGDAIAQGRLTGAKGFGDRKIAQLRAAVAAAATTPTAGRLPLEVAYPLARAIVAALRNRAPVREVETAGSLRRGKESVGDLDILATSDAPEEVFEVFTGLPEVREVRLRGPTKETAVLSNGLQVDLRVVEPEAFGAALQYFTGSKDHNVRLRSLARDRGLKINEYGVFRGDERVAGRTEEEVYATLDLPWIPPELREDRGEIPAAQAHRLPTLIGPGDLRGELHCHLPPPASVRELEAIVAAAMARALDYVGVVVAGIDDRDQPWRAPSPVLERLRAGPPRAPRLFAVAEVGGSEAVAPPADLPIDYLLLRPTAASGALAVPPSGPPTRLLGHLPSTDVEGNERLLGQAASLRLAVEVGPGRGDSTLARAAREAGAAIYLPTGVAEPDASVTREVAIAWARRAGAEKKDVLNAGAFEPATPGRRRPNR